MYEPRLSVLFRARAVAALTFTVALGSSAAQAQEAPVVGSFALDRYEPTPTGDRFFSVPSGAVDGRGVLRLGLTLDYSSDPLVIQDTCSDVNGDGVLQGAEECNQDETTEVGSVVSDQLVAHVGVSYALFGRLLLSLNLPMVLVNSGDNVVNPRSPNTVISAPDGAAIGDLRLGVRAQVAGRAKGPAELGLGAYLWFPTGVPDEFTGDDSARFMPHVSVNGRMGNIVYGGQVGIALRESTDYVNVKLGSELTYGAAVGVLLAKEKLQLGPELYGSTVVANDVSPFKGRTTHAELLAALRYRTGDVVLGAAVGPGLTHGLGSPGVRALATVGFSPAQADADGDGISDRDDACPKVAGSADKDPKKNGCPPDQDGDGVLDGQDACPTQPGVADPDPARNGCPPAADRDADGVSDDRDACPDVRGVPSDDPKRNGCPSDRDGDGVADDVDACPDVRGLPNNQDPKKNGCPPDRDGDTIADDKDACPDAPGLANPDPVLNGCPGDTDGDTIRDDQDACPKEKGAPDPDPQKNGCPKLVRVTAGAIKILQQVQFETGSAKILPASDPLLNEVTAVLKEHPEIKKIRVDGHTDSQGADAMNMQLSADRAASVRKWLVDHGVETTRLESAGFGETVAIGDNATDEGRQKNRRVEFNIIDPAPPAGQGGPTPPPQPAPGAKPAAKPPSAGGGGSGTGGGTGGGKPAGQPPAGGQKPGGTAPPKPPPAGGGAKPGGAGTAQPATPIAPKPPAGGQPAPKKP